MADTEEFDEDEPVVDTSFKDSIVVDGLPIVVSEKREKLTNVIRKFFTQVGMITNLEMPMEPDGSKSMGFAFVEFDSSKAAEDAVQKANGYKLDKSHTFIVNLLSDYHNYQAIPDKEAEFQPPEYVAGENLRSWLMDENARDQFGALHTCARTCCRAPVLVRDCQQSPALPPPAAAVTPLSLPNPTLGTVSLPPPPPPVVRYNEETEIWWNDPTKPNNEPSFSKKHWSDSYVSWSPNGVYLVTFHRLG